MRYVKINQSVVVNITVLMWFSEIFFTSLSNGYFHAAFFKWRHEVRKNKLLRGLSDDVKGIAVSAEGSRINVSKFPVYVEGIPFKADKKYFSEDGKTFNARRKPIAAGIFCDMVSFLLYDVKENRVDVEKK